MSEKYGVVIQHGCGKKIFVSKKTLETTCSLLCPKCGVLIGLSLFGSKRKEKLLKYCKTYSDEELKKLMVGGG